MANPEKRAQSANQFSVAGGLVRLGWMSVGPAALILSTFLILNHKGGFFCVGDAVFWGIVLLLVGLRYIDIAWMHGDTASGRPATMFHWRRYVILLVIVALALWSLAHSEAFFGR